MPEKLADILKFYLVIENHSLRDLLLEILDLCQPPKDPSQARLMLEAKVRKFSSNVDQLEKVPYCHLFLSYVYLVLEDYERAANFAGIGIDGFDQLNHVWNRSIARWIRGLIYKTNGNLDDAQLDFDAAIKLMTQEMQDLKRRSRYALAENCAVVLEKILADAKLLQISSVTYLLPPRSPESVPFTYNPETTPKEKSEAELFQDLLRKVGGIAATAEALIEYEISQAPRASRVEHIRMAIARWERDNQ